ncbi:MAG: Mu transposase C-terminal domain-containing protein [Rhodospirillales bacterium]|nr:Mu transposase C-terminal domain-containing protein [Rhodospirillales bacterium]
MNGEWFTASEMITAKIPNLPGSVQGITKKARTENWRTAKDRFNNPLAVKTKEGWKYHYSLFPASAQAQISLNAASKNVEPIKASKAELNRSEAWRYYEQLNDKKKKKAGERLQALEAVLAMEKAGMRKNSAVIHAALEFKVGKSSIFNWFKLVEGKDRADWLPYLIPHHTGRQQTVECSPDAWEALKANYLRAERKSFTACYRDTVAIGEQQGWTIPPERTLKRRMDREIPATVQELRRYGVQALKGMFPPQERDKTCFHALQEVNCDGHKWDVAVKWPDGEIGRVCMMAIQDVYSAKYLSWRFDKSENKEAFRLTIGDMIETYGLPEGLTIDNTRAAANKWLTGGVPNRFRYKIKDDDPTGILVTLGVEVHWTTPYSGQSKPIERGFRDFCDAIAKDPRFAGAWVGNNPLNKPENYGSKAIPLDKFIEVVEYGIQEHNSRLGRRSKVCQGRSIDQAFEESYKVSKITKLLPEQQRLWLMAAEGIRASRQDGALKLLGNRFWGEFMSNHHGEKLVVRFDPQDLHSGIHVYKLDNSYLGFADCIHAVGFNSVEAAQEHGRNRRRWMKAQKEAAKALIKMEIGEVAEMMPTATESVNPEAKVVKQVFNTTDKPTTKRKKKNSGPVIFSDLTEEQEAAADAMFQKLNEEDEASNVTKFPIAANSAERPHFSNDAEFVQWVMDNPNIATDSDKKYTAELLENPSIRLLLGIEDEINEESHLA